MDLLIPGEDTSSLTLTPGQPPPARRWQCARGHIHVESHDSAIIMDQPFSIDFPRLNLFSGPLCEVCVIEALRASFGMTGMAVETEAGQPEDPPA